MKHERQQETCRERVSISAMGPFYEPCGNPLPCPDHPVPSPTVEAEPKCATNDPNCGGDYHGYHMPKLAPVSAETDRQKAHADGEEWVDWQRCPYCDRIYEGRLDDFERFWCTTCGKYVYPPVSSHTRRSSMPQNELRGAHDWTHPAEDCDVEGCGHITRRTCEAAEKTIAFLRRTNDRLRTRLYAADPNAATADWNRVMRGLEMPPEYFAPAPQTDRQKAHADLLTPDEIEHFATIRVEHPESGEPVFDNIGLDWLDMNFDRVVNTLRAAVDRAAEEER